MTALREIAAAFGVTFDGSALEAGTKKIDALKTTLANFAGIKAFELSLQGVVAAARDLTVGFASTSEALRRQSVVAQVSAHDLQAYGFAAEQGGGRAEDLTNALNELSHASLMATTPSGPMTMALWRLGVRLRDTHRHARPAVDVLNDLAVKFDKVQSPIKKARYAQMLFGDSGRVLLPILHGGAGGVRDLADSFDLLGGGISDRAIEAGKKFTTILSRNRVATDTLRSSIAVVLLPVVGWFVEKATRLTVTLAKVVRTSSTLQTALIALGVAGAVALAPLVVSAAAAIAPFGALFLVVEDLVTWARGGKSAFGALLDSMLGVGGSQATLNAVKAVLDDIAFGWEEIKRLAPEAWEAISSAAEIAWQKVTQWGNALERFTRPIARFLGMDTGEGERGVRGVDNARRAGLLRTQRQIDAEASQNRASEETDARGNLAARQRGVTPGGGDTRVTSRGESIAFGEEVRRRAREASIALREAERPAGSVRSPGAGGHRAGVTEVQQRNQVAIHVHATEQPEATARAIQQRLVRSSAADIARAHAARRDLTGG